MGFWVFMLLMNLLIPATMLGFGYRLWKHPPNRINALFGYRTARSMKNRATWEFANRHAGRLWVRFGWVSIALAVLGMLPLLGKDTDTIGTWGALLTLVLCIPLITAVPLTERALKKHFDPHGRKY